jgi:hypothetical protein
MDLNTVEAKQRLVLCQSAPSIDTAWVVENLVCNGAARSRIGAGTSAAALR